MTMMRPTRGFGLFLSATLLIGCTGDDASTSATGDTDGTTDGTDSTSTTSTTNTTTLSTTATTTMGTGSESNSMSGTETTTMGTTEMTTTMGTTDPSTTDMTTTMGGVCGDGVLDAGEECDDGPANGSMRSMCSSECTIVNDSVCGNGEVEMGEDCDDGNTEDGDGCSANCTTEVMDECGDGIISGDEACDDGNAEAGDGCEPDCTLTPPGECGNGVQEWDELCDDGNLENNDGCEDNCTPTPLPNCQPPENYISCDGMLNKADPLAPFQAIGLACNDKPNESIQISGIQFNSPNQNAWQIIKGFGTYMEMGKRLYSPREGEAFVIMSSGNVSQPNGQGILTEANGSQGGNGNNNNPDDDAFLPGYTPAQDQSGVLQPQWQLGDNDPNDKIWWSFKTKTPTGTKGYSIDFAFFSSEWPVYHNTSFNDLFVAWEVSEAYVGTISVIDGLSTTITALNPHWTSMNDPNCSNPAAKDGPGFSCDEPQLAGTGFEGDAGTAWVRINQPIEEGKDLELFFFLADMSDSILASAVILDRFRFSCEECIPADDPQCTGEVPDPNCCGVVLPT